MNLAVVVGTLSSDPRARTLPSGTELVTYEVTTTESDGSRCTVPIAWLDPSRPPVVRAGDEVVVVGRVRRRFFRAGGTTVSRTEIEAKMVSRPRARRAARALDEARGILARAGSLG